jgi:large subunit ribosomal protein L15
VKGKRGFENIFKTELSPINLNRIQYWINAHRLDPTKPITLKELNANKCLHGVKKDGVKLLARGMCRDVPIPIIIANLRLQARRN